MTQTIDGRCYGYEPAQSELNALRTKIERLKADVVQRDREIERLKYDHKLAQDAWRTEVACAERSKARPAKVAALQTEIERLKAEKDQMYQLGRSIEIERDNLKAEIKRLKTELRIWQECSARQDHEFRAELEAKLAEARGEGFSEGAKGAFAWQERAKRAEDKLAKVQSEIERLDRLNKYNVAQAEADRELAEARLAKVVEDAKEKK